MDLPQELIDEIINHIPPNDRKSHHSCSLVAKLWVYPSRRRIFKAIDLSEATRLKLWLDKIPPTNLKILQHVRLLQYQTPQPFDPLHPSADPLHDYLPSFQRLEGLSFFLGFIPSPTQIKGYTAFQHTISHLSLRSCSVTASALVTSVNYFPNLAHLELVDLNHYVDVQPVPPFSRPLQRLSVTEFYADDSLGLVDQLMELCLQCEEVAIRMYWFPSPSLAQRIIDGVWASVKCLNLGSHLEGVFNVPKSPVVRMSEHSAGTFTDLGNPLTLSKCRELCELEIYALRPGPVELDLISSITSTKIRKIAFTQPLTFEGQRGPHSADWAKLDDSLCRLIDQLESGVQLEVEFQALDAQTRWSGELRFRRFLPRFYEKGEAGVGQGK